MARALWAGSFLVTLVTGIAVVTLVAGLVISARPEVATVLGLSLSWRDGLATALVSGVVVIGGTVLGRVLSLLRDDSSNGKTV